MAHLQSSASRHTGDAAHPSNVSTDAKYVFWGQVYHTCSTTKSTFIFIFTFTYTDTIYLCYLSIFVYVPSDLTFCLRGFAVIFEGVTDTLIRQHKGLA